MITPPQDGQLPESGTPQDEQKVPRVVAAQFGHFVVALLGADIGWKANMPPSRTCGYCANSKGRILYNHMVVRSSTLSDADIDNIFRALSDSTRRDIVERVLVGEQSVSALADRYDMSFAAVQKHVAVLERAGLVSKRAVGRERLVSGKPERIARARDLLTQLEGLWKARFSQLDAVLAEHNPRE